MKMKYFRGMEVSPSLRGSVEFCILGGTPSPRGLGVGGQSTTRAACGLGTQERGFVTHRILWKNHDGYMACYG